MVRGGDNGGHIAFLNHVDQGTPRRSQRLVRFQATPDPGVKASSRLHHARCGEARCDRIAANRRYSGSCSLRRGHGLRVDQPLSTQPACLENRQHVATCEQIFSNDRLAGAGHRPKVFGNQRLSGWHASCFSQWQRSIVPTIAPGWRAEHCKVHAMIASCSRLSCARRATTKLHIRGGLGALRTTISTGSAASPAAELHCGFAPFRCNNRHKGE
jgi:hypothetical protein